MGCVQKKMEGIQFCSERLKQPVFAEGARTGAAEETEAEQRPLSLQFQVKENKEPADESSDEGRRALCVFFASRILSSTSSTSFFPKILTAKYPASKKNPKTRKPQQLLELDTGLQQAELDTR